MVPLLTELPFFCKLMVNPDTGFSVQMAFIRKYPATPTVNWKVPSPHSIFDTDSFTYKVCESLNTLSSLFIPLASITLEEATAKVITSPIAHVNEFAIST